MELTLKAQMKKHETPEQTMARVVTTPECLSACTLTICQNIDQSEITEVAEELAAQSKAIRSGDMARAEDMLVAQAHALDGLFAKLARLSLTAESTDSLERYMRLALRAQGQARATLQTLAEIKMPRQVAFVRQANIGEQLQVNNCAEGGSRASKNHNAQNELLEASHGERLDTGAAGAAGGDDQKVEAVERKHGA